MTRACPCGKPACNRSNKPLCAECRDSRALARKRLKQRRRYHRNGGQVGRDRARLDYQRHKAARIAKSDRWRADNPDRYRELCADSMWRRRIAKRFGEATPSPEVLEMLVVLREFRSRRIKATLKAKAEASR